VVKRLLATVPPDAATLAAKFAKRPVPTFLAQLQDVLDTLKALGQL